MRLCLDRGADVNLCCHVDPHGRPGRETESRATPLYVACWQGHAAAARLCLDRGADVEFADEDGWTPLYVACVHGRIDAARLCLERGADIKRSCGDDDLCPFAAAFFHENDAMALWLLRIKGTGWTQHLSETRYKLVVLRALAARGDATRQRAFHGKERVLDLLFPGVAASAPAPSGSRPARRHQRLPDELFLIIVRYYWGGGMSAEDEATADAEKAAAAAALAAEVAAETEAAPAAS